MTQDDRLGDAALDAIQQMSNRVEVSPASYWELAIKISLGKYRLAEPFHPFIERQIELNTFFVLPIEPKHTAVVAEMPFHHRDPFDRLIIAQAIAEGIPVVSSDGAFDAYGVQRVW